MSTTTNPLDRLEGLKVLIAGRLEPDQLRAMEAIVAELRESAGTGESANSAVVDLSALIAMREQFASQLDEINKRLNVDDPAAYETAQRMLTVEETAAAAAVERFRSLCGESADPERYVESFRESLDGLRVTGDLYAYVDYYRARRSCDEVVAALPALLDRLAGTNGYWGGDDAEMHRKALGMELAESVRSYVGAESYIPKVPA